MNRRLITGLIALLAFGALLMATRLQEVQPSLDITFLEFERRDSDSAIVVMELKNTGSSTACYSGYRLDSPAYEVSVQSETGWTNAPTRFWCGTGLQPVFLRPGKSVRFRVFLFTNRLSKVGIAFRERTLSDSLPEPVAQWLPDSFFAPEPMTTVWSSLIEFPPSN